MKKLLWCVGVVLALCVWLIVASLRNPRSAVIGLSRSSNGVYDEIMVVKRDRTFEQLFRSRKNGLVLLHSGIWMPSSEDPSAPFVLGQSGSKTDNYITYEKRIRLTPGSLTLGEAISSMEPTMFMQLPREDDLAEWQRWRAMVKP